MDTMNLKKHFILLLFVLLTSFVYSQPDYQTQMDDIFNIPAYKVTTGVLINRSMDIVDMQDFKLQSNIYDTTTINTRNWLELFYRLYASHLNLNSFSYDVTLANKYPGKTADGQIPLGLIYYHYDKIKNYAVQNGLLSVDTISQKITDISPAGQSPLETDTCFAAAPLADTITVGTHAFILKDSLYVSNNQPDVQEIYIDFDNGQGYVRVYPNQPISVSYSATGNKTLTTKIVIASKNYYASSYLYVSSTPLAQETEGEIRIFPNPVENRLNIRLFNRIEGEIRITVIDTKGQIIHLQSIMDSIDNIIDCSQFVSGIYFIHIAFSNSVQKTIKIIKK